MIVVPHDQLRPETLDALIEEFVTRDGSVHGQQEVLLQRMIEEVRSQLLAEKVLIVFDEVEETFTLMPKDHSEAIPRP